MGQQTPTAFTVARDTIHRGYYDRSEEDAQNFLLDTLDTLLGALTEEQLVALQPKLEALTDTE